MALEAVRGARELTLTVPAGPLGITVSALLHRIGSARRPKAGVIWASRDDERADAGEQRLVEVPDELVPQVRLLAEVLQRPANAKQRKKATALVVTRRGSVDQPTPSHRCSSGFPKPAQSPVPGERPLIGQVCAFDLS